MIVFQNPDLSLETRLTESGIVNYPLLGSIRLGGLTVNAAEKLIAEIEKLFPQVQQVVASSDFGRDAIDKAKAIVEKARAAIEKKDVAAVKEQIEGLTRTHRMFKGVVAKT